jgi:hypothetical protein
MHSPEHAIRTPTAVANMHDETNRQKGMGGVPLGEATEPFLTRC